MRLAEFVDAQITFFKSLKFHAMNVPGFRKFVHISKMHV